MYEIYRLIQGGIFYCKNKIDNAFCPTPEKYVDNEILIFCNCQWSTRPPEVADQQCMIDNTLDT